MVFLGPNGREILNAEDITKIRATSPYATPEIPIHGTAGSILAMLAGFGYYIRSGKTPTYLP